MLVENKTIDLSNLRILVMGVMAYGNVGDELETLPLFQKLREWGVGRVDAVLDPWSVSMCNDHSTPIPKTGSQYLSGTLVNNIFIETYEEPFDLVADTYDIVIQAPGPDFSHRVAEAAHKAQIPLLVFGVSIRRTQVHSYVQFRQTVRCIVAREPVSFQFICDIESNSASDSFISVAMAGDIGFSVTPYLDHSAINYFRDQVVASLPQKYNLVFLRSDGRIRLNNSGRNRAFRLRDEDSEKSWPLSEPFVLATTDKLVDRDLFERYALEFPEVRQVECNRIEDLWALTSGAKHVYTTRYHPGVMSLLTDTHFSVLPCQHSSKMDGLKALKEGIDNGIYKVSNENGWEVLKSQLNSLVDREKP